jgi:hypothetical protein
MMAPADLQSSLSRLERWLMERNFKGFDPHDALRSGIVRTLTFHNRLLGIAWVQLLRRSPVNFRRVLRVKPGYNPKGMGLFLTGYLRWYQVTGNDSDRVQIQYFADWLRNNQCKGYSGACWGYNFDWPNRSFFAPAGTPTVVNTAFIAHAFLDLYEAFDRAEDFDLAHSACKFMLGALSRATEPLGFCFSYTPLDRRRVHNANMLAASLLARVAAVTHDEEYRDAARQAVIFTVTRQNADGSWPYGMGASESWIDNFHTGFVLVSLLEYIRYTGEREFESSLQAGYQFWKSEFFTTDGVPKFYRHQTYPIDVHCVAQGVLTFLAFADRDKTALERGLELARWATANLQDQEGYFYYQIGRYYRNRIPYIRWAQAWMFRALAECCASLASQRAYSCSLSDNKGASA